MTKHASKLCRLILAVFTLQINLSFADNTRADNLRMFDSTSDPRELAHFLLSSGVDKRGLVVESQNVAGFRVLFEFDSAKITPDALTVIDVLGRALRDPMLAQASFLIEGHTDAIGPASYNLQLSEKRAESVKNYLVQAYGIDEGNLLIEGKGESELMTNISPTNKVNRRVQLRVVPSSGKG